MYFVLGELDPLAIVFKDLFDIYKQSLFFLLSCHAFSDLNQLGKFVLSRQIRPCARI